MVQRAPITGLLDSCSPSPPWFTYTGSQPMAGLQRILLALEKLSPWTPCRKQWSTAHNLRPSLCTKEFILMSNMALFFLPLICGYQHGARNSGIFGLFLSFSHGFSLWPVLSGFVLEMLSIQGPLCSQSSCLDRKLFRAVS